MARKVHAKVPKLPVEAAAEPSPTLRPFPIVALGASAGGLEALEQFFTHLPVDSGMAFVVVQIERVPQ